MTAKEHPHRPDLDYSNTMRNGRNCEKMQPIIMIGKFWNNVENTASSTPGGVDLKQFMNVKIDKSFKNLINSDQLETQSASSQR